MTSSHSAQPITHQNSTHFGVSTSSKRRWVSQSSDSEIGVIERPGPPPLCTRRESARSAGSKLSVAGSGSGEGGGGNGVSSSSPGPSPDGAVANARSGASLPVVGTRRAGADFAKRALATGIVIVVGVEEPGRSPPMAELGSGNGGTGQRSGDAC